MKTLKSVDLDYTQVIQLLADALEAKGVKIPPNAEIKLRAHADGIVLVWEDEVRS